LHQLGSVLSPSNSLQRQLWVLR